MNNTLTNIRVIAYSPKTHIGNVSKNVDDIIKFYNEHTNTADVILKKSAEIQLALAEWMNAL